jgi:hypothetical protein
VIVPFRDEIFVFHRRFLLLLWALSRDPRSAVHCPGLSSLRGLFPGIPRAIHPNLSQALSPMISDNERTGIVMNRSSGISGRLARHL